MLVGGEGEGEVGDDSGYHRGLRGVSGLLGGGAGGGTGMTRKLYGPGA